MERVMSRGGVMLDGGRRYAAAVVLTTAIGLSVIPDAYAALDIGPGMTVNGVTVDAVTDNPMNVFSGGVAIGTTINSGGSQYVYSNGLASGTTISGLSSGGTPYYGTQNVSSGGSAIGTTISNIGQQNVYESGIANSTTINSGGLQYVYSGGAAINTTINGGTQYVSHDGAITTTTVNSGGTIQLVGVSGVASINMTGSNIIKDGGILMTDPGMTINLSGTATTLTIERGASTPNTTLNNSFTGAGSLTKDGAGTLTLTGENSYTGRTEVKDGALALSGTGTLGNNGSGGLTLHGGARFDFSGITPASLDIPSLTVNGLGASINAIGKTADFSNSNLFFNIPNTAVVNDKLLIVDGNADITGASVGLDTPSGRPNINLGEKVILLDVTGTLASDLTTLTVKTISGDIYAVQVDGKQLQAILSQLSSTSPTYERMKAYLESRAANLAFINQGLDFILNRGFGSALLATSGQGFRISSFGGFGGGWSRYKSGSHVDVSGLSLLAGFALGNDVGPGRVTLGAFFEGGRGDYTSYNVFSNAASVKGKGDTSYYGTGILGRYDINQGDLSGLYFDASARLGWTRTDFCTSDIQYNGWNVNFETSALYYSLHGGLGYVWLIPGTDDKGSLDLSVKILWTRQQGDSVTVYLDRVRFKDADSLRTRLGWRFAYAVNEYVIPYIGAYWEHEFDGKLRATVNDQRLSSPSLQGDTGMGEFGLSFKPSKTLLLSFDLGVQGYVGKREGVTGSLQVRYEF